MATLRTNIGVNTESGLANTLQDQDVANNMGSLRRGFQTGSIGNDITGLAADEISLRAQGRVAEADSLRQQIGALKQRQAIYAPEVQDVTKVDGLGSALGWAGGAVGQGVASMMEPMAAATGLNALGTAAGLVPGVGKAVGAGLRLAAPLAAYGINARHLKGEVADAFHDDPTIMANHSAQELNNKANLYGGIAGIADTAFPSIVGRQLGGVGFGKGLLKHGGARLGAELAGEGVTEALQDYGSQQLRGTLNPNRDTSGDTNSLVNSFAGGVAGAGPFAVAGHYADQGFRRVGDGVDRVSEAAGNVVDLAGQKLDESGAVDAAKGAASKGAGFLKGMFSKGKDKVVDLAGEDGKVTVDSVKNTFRDATNGIKKQDGISTEDQAVMRGDVPDHLHGKTDTPEFEQWATQRHEVRTNKVLDHLEAMSEKGDATATDLFTKVNDAMDVPSHTAAVNEAADYILQNNELAREMSNAEAFGKLAGMGGKAMGKGAMAAGKLAASFGKSVWDGMKEGAKKNLQGSLDGFDEHEAERQSQVGGNYIKQQAAMKQSRDRAEMMGQYLAAMAQAEKPRYSATGFDTESVPAYMKSVGYEIADIADSWDLQGKGTAKAATQPSGPASMIQTTEDKKSQQFPGLKLNLNRIVNSMRVMLGKDQAAEALTQLQNMYQGNTAIAPLFEFMHDELATQSSRQGHQHTAQVRDEAAQAILTALPQERELALMKEGISLRTPEGRKELLSMVEQISANHGSHEAREASIALAKLVGRQALTDMLGVVNANLKEPKLQEKIVDDRGQTEEYDGDYAMDENGDFVATQSANDFEKNQATRLVAKGSGPKIYGYDYGHGMRHSTGKTDPFAPSKRVSKKELDAWNEENAARSAVGQELKPDPRQGQSGRPRLFVRGRTLADGTNAIEKKIEDMSKLMGVDRTPENAVKILREEQNEKAASTLEGLIAKAAKGDEAAQQRIEDSLDSFYENRAGSWDFKAKSAHEVMKERNYSDGQRLSAFRDYLHIDKEPVKAQAVADMLNDLIDTQRKGEPTKQTPARTSPGLRKQIMAAMDKYFKERDVVVGEQMSNRDNTQITAPELLEMAVQGRKVIDLARKPGNEKDAAGMIDRANILTFKSKLSTSKDGLLHIPAGALVNWVKKQNGLTRASNIEDQSEYGNKDVNSDYLGAVLQGVWQIAASGMADGLPYKLNGRGERESFEKGVPPSLRLATSKAEHAQPKRWTGDSEGEGGNSPGQYSDIGVFTLAHKDYAAQLAANGGDLKKTYAAMRPIVEAEMAALKAEKGTRGYDLALKRAMRKANLKENEDGHFAVGVDQSKGGSFVVDDTPAESEHMSGKTFLKGEGQFNSDKFNPHPSDDEDVSGMNTTPLDFFKPQKDGERRDDFADVLGRTKEGGESAYSMRKSSLGIEHATDALERAETRGEALVAKLIDNPAEGMADLTSRMRSALRPAYVEAEKSDDPRQYAKNIAAAKNQAVGGKQYLYPAAHALSPENIQAVLTAADLGPEEAATMKAELTNMRKAAASIATRVGLTPRQMVAVAKMLATEDKRGMINAVNVTHYLTNLGKDADFGSQQAVSKGGADTSKQYDLTKKKATLTLRPKGTEGPVAKDGSRMFDAPMGGGRTGEQAAVQRRVAGGAVAPSGKSQQSGAHDPYAGFKDTDIVWAVRAGEDEDGGGKVLAVFRDLGKAQAEAERAGGNLEHNTVAGLKADEADQNGAKADWTDTGKKYSLMSHAIHLDLERDGFPATHDSPIKHAGKFDWRSHKGKGEGNASFGAGTYLSTSEGVHQNYKDQFTSKINEDEGGYLYEATNELRAAQDDLSRAEQRVERSKAMADAKNWVKRRQGSYKFDEHLIEHNGEWGKGYIVVHSEFGVPLGSPSETLQGAVDQVYNNAEGRGPFEDDLKEAQERLAAAEKEYREVMGEVEKSPTYEVSVDIKPEQLLDWNKSLSGQSALVKKALSSAMEWKKQRAWNGDTVHQLVLGNKLLGELKDAADTLSGKFEAGNGRYGEKFDTLAQAQAAVAAKVIGSVSVSGEVIYEGLTQKLGSQAKASDYLQSLGILGHKYAASGGKNNAHPNYVIYDDSKIVTNFVRFNQQKADGEGNGMPASQAQMDEAKAYVQKVLGKDVRVAFEKAMGHAGEWVEAENLIKISTTSAAGQLQTAYHEALHAFFSKYVKNSPHMFEVMKTIAEDPKIVERLHALLDGHPAAQAQLAHGEERLAYAYQFWAAGKLDLPGGAPKTFFGKLRALFKRILGMVTDSDRAVAVFEAFHGGKLSDPSAAGQVLAKELARGTWTRNQLKSMDTLVQWVAGKTMPSEVVLTSSASPRAQALARELYTNPADEKAGGTDEGYMNAKSRHAKQYSNKFKKMLLDLGLSDRDLQDVGEHMMKQTELADIPYQPVRKAVMQTRQLTQRFYRYMTEERGMQLGNLGGKYYPRVWNKTQLIENGHGFIEMLREKYPEVLADGVAASKGKMSENQVGTRILNAIINGGEIMQKTGPQRDDGVLAPYFMSKRVRSLEWLKTEDSAPWQDKNFAKTMLTYFHDGARAAEYTSRFGERGEVLDAALTQIRNELDDHSLNMLTKKEFKDDAARKKWVQSQMRDVRDAVAAMEGTIGKNISNRWRKANSWVTAYQNIRLLPLMLFSSMVDPMAMVGRGAPMREAYDAYLRGMKEVFANWADMFRDEPKKRTADKWELLAEAAGVVDVALFTNHVSDEYSSVFMDGNAKKINDVLFKMNGMEAWDRGMRIAATKSAALFIARHKALPDATHSARWLAEVGLTPEDIHLDERGELITDKHDLQDTLGITKEDAERQADKMNYALARWVQGAVLSPNAAHRPAWGSDPHYSMFFHLKQFTYSFHQTVLKRAVNELEYGNLAPMGTFAWYIPVMIASDVTKGLIQGGGELPSHMKGMDAAQWLMRGAERGGMLGIGAIGVDAGHDLASLGGPAVEQIMDAWGTPARNTAINALPLHGLYAEALK
jgi:hypothetical protein